MSATTYLRLDIEAEVLHFTDDRPGKADATSKAKDAQRRGKRQISLYRMTPDGAAPLLIRKYKPQAAPAYFKAAALRTERDGIPPLVELPSQAHASHLMDCIFSFPNGSIFVSHMAEAVEPKTPRDTKVIRGLFILRAEMTGTGCELRFSLIPMTTDLDGLVACLRTAAKGNPLRRAKTGHARRHSTGRVRSISLSISR